jgi:hypothetical protein
MGHDPTTRAGVGHPLFLLDSADILLRYPWDTSAKFHWGDIEIA